MSVSTTAPMALNSLTFPLHGARLIEASAGTGKTFTIASLYLRLLLGHGDDQTRHARPLSVEEILVVTFTEAATAELKDRIRERIHQAYLAFQQGESNDEVIATLLAAYPQHQQAAQLLLMAQRQMDTAAIYTIHGFCQRMLIQHAFESGSHFQQEFIHDIHALNLQVVADYWRQHCYDLPLDVAQAIRALWNTPARLLTDIEPYLSDELLTIIPSYAALNFIELYQRQYQRIEQLKQAWRDQASQIPVVLAASDLHKNSQNALIKRLAILNDWANSATTELSVADELMDFAQSTLQEKTKKGIVPHLALFAEIDELKRQPISLKPEVLSHAIHHCRLGLKKAKAERQWLYFDDLLSQLATALNSDSNVLAQRIRACYPVAMIDEFQDTDPLQYQIFSQIYLSEPQAALLMIGDPKQAIYSFRGADIFTYLQARQQISAHYNLGTNWRSSQAMVQAVNQLFSTSSDPFLYGQQIPFLPVNASPNANQRQWWLAKQPQSALNFWLIDQDALLTKSDYQAQMTQATVAKIYEILSLAQQDQAYFEYSEQQKRIEPKDIAVLVRTGREGRMIKQALAEKGIASVYLSNRDSVFSSAIAQDILRILQTLLQLDNSSLLRTCLASPLFHYSLAQLEQLQQQEDKWDQVVNEFKHYAHLWRTRGVLPMLHTLLHQRQIAQHLLTQPLGERALTDYLHLSELLQQAAQELDSPLALASWLLQAIEEAKLGVASSEQAIQRLESEHNLVQIITIHKSKGLEYPLVFLPFVMNYQEAKQAKYYDAVQGMGVVDFYGNPEALRQADHERLAEDMRLLYVALTRAVYGCFVGVAALRKGRATKPPSAAHLSALGALLQDQKEGDADTLKQGLARQAQSSTIVVTAPPLAPESALVTEKRRMPSLSLSQLSRAIDRHWRISSYSGLMYQAQFDVLPIKAGFDLDSIGEDKITVDTHKAEVSALSFPRGAQAGTFLHSLLEQIDFTQPLTSQTNHDLLVQLMERESIAATWLAVLQEWLEQVLATPLDGQDLVLQRLMPAQKLTEMEFMLAIHEFNASDFNRFQQYDPLSRQASYLNFDGFSGMLKGFIDLVFEYQGRYYVLDWKSNYLGDKPSDYQGANLEAAMLAHRYDVQYHLYSLALHQYLRLRLPNYDYHSHFGGVYYLFLRGMDGKTQNGVFYARPEYELLNELSALIRTSETA